MAQNKIYGDCEGPLGFPMKSEQASALEALMKDLPAECKKRGLIRRTFVPKAIELDDGERADVSLITTDSIDRDAEVIFPKGVVWTSFLKNPVVTFNHQYGKLPVGRCLWVKRQKQDKKSKGNSANGWLGKTQYTSRPPADLWPVEKAWFPDAVWWFVKSGDLPGKSIGFIPLEIRGPTPDEIKARPELAEVRAVIPKSHALEYAVATVQSNPDTLVQQVAKAKSAGIGVPAEMLAELGLYIPEPIVVVTEPEPVVKDVEPEPVIVTPPVIDAEAIRKMVAAGAAVLLASVPGMVENELDRQRGKV